MTVALKSKTKTVEVDGQKYLIRKLSANVGSFILARVLAASAGGIVASKEGEQNSTIMASMFAAFLRGLNFEEFSFIQNHCLAVVARLETPAGSPEVPMPIVTDSGVFAITEVGGDLPLVMNLTIQSLLFNLSDFFDLTGSSAALAGKPSASTQPVTSA
jgi:hypothetical protein